MEHVTIGLAAGFISLAFFDVTLKKLCGTGEQHLLACLIAVCVGLTSYSVEWSYDRYLDTVAKKEIAFVQAIRKEEEMKYFNQVNSRFPLRLNGQGYLCRRYD